MKKIFKQMFFVLCLLAAPLGVNAQTLVFHLAGGEKTTVPLPATFTVTPTDDKLVIDAGVGNVVELSKDDVMCVTYRDAKGDVNGDQRVDVADVSTLVGIVIGKDGGDNPSSSGSAPDGVVAVDLGLPSGTKWANMNVGASKPEDYGGYYAWGETQTKPVYNEVSYSYFTGQDTDGDGWIDENFSIVNIGSDIAGTQYDAATANWGAPWRMPSLAQIKELFDNTTSVWTTLNGVYGRKFTGSNGGTIFLPAAGGHWSGGLSGVGSYGEYWSSTLGESGPHDAYRLYFDSGGTGWYDFGRVGGRSVRPVR